MMSDCDIRLGSQFEVQSDHYKIETVDNKAISDLGANLVASLHMSKIEKIINTDDKVTDMIIYDKE